MNDINNRRSLREVLPKGEYSSKQQSEDKRVIYWEPERSTAIGVKALSWFMVVVVAGVLVFFLSSYVSWVKVKIVLKQADITVDGVYQANSEGANGSLVFQTISGVDDSVSKKVNAVGSQKVSRRATGEVVLYNSFNSASQTLVATTRLEATNGKIYRLVKGVTIPGMQGDTPGSIRAEVQADQPGAEYNIGQTTFTVVGFKGTPRYDKFSAKTNGISGGFVGEEKTVPVAERSALEQELRSQLKDKLLAKARAQLPQGFVLYDGAAFVSFSDLEISSANRENSTDEAVAVQRGSLTAIIFSVDNLSNYLIKNRSTEDSADAVSPTEIKSPEKLIFSLVGRDGLDPNNLKTVSFSIEGKATFVWKLDESTLKTKLTGATKNNYRQVLSGFPAVESAEIIFRPPWISKFPKDPQRIKIDITS